MCFLCSLVQIHTHPWSPIQIKQGSQLTHQKEKILLSSNVPQHPDQFSTESKLTFTTLKNSEG